MKIKIRLEKNLSDKYEMTCPAPSPNETKQNKNRAMTLGC